ncbi:MAG: iron transporter [Candidatus Liptonbacteria bacterium RIFOXYC1_FULL_36_8]|uniref:Iron transporter n=1 Tax=Candidatus Liptonbacteria bacterium RIFOXYC1_FULL_36_8 TaxID=1798655 RepID=A0A1G2CNX9_9BACT|nr:MAG: iron transporter [Candidatus Liptonbacteria bacterium RIFOXYC1_FULL_36_8]
MEAVYKKIRKFLKKLGPGFITGASDDDPSAIATYSQSGAEFGYRQLWTPLFSLPFMIVVLEMAGRIGLVTGKGLAGIIKRYYSKKLLYTSVLLLLFANIINIGAVLGAMAAVLNLLLGINFLVALIAIVIISLALEMFIPYRIYVKFLKYLTISLFAYIIAAFSIPQNWSQILSATFFPKIYFTPENIINLVAIFGTTISPYLFFWQADEEVEEEILHHKLKITSENRPKITTKDLKIMRFDTIIGMFFSNIVAFFIILTAAATLWPEGINNISTATEAAEALKPLAGNFAFFLFALGIIGTGMLSLPILASSASYAFSEAFGFKEGLYRKWKKARVFYGVIFIATILGLLVNFSSIPPFKMLYFGAVLNGIIAPLLLIIMLLIANNKKIMGDFTNSKLSNILAVIITSFMAIIALYLLYDFFKNWDIFANFINNII